MKHEGAALALSFRHRAVDVEGASNQAQAANFYL